MLTLKFGGTSVADADAVERLCGIVARTAGPRVVVVSALAGITDQLLEILSQAECGEIARAHATLGRLRARHASLALVVRDPRRRAGVTSALDTYWDDLAARLRAASRSDVWSAAARDAVVAAGELASSRLVAAALADRAVPAAWVDARAVVATDATHGHAAPLADDTAARVQHELVPRLQAGLVPVVGGFVGRGPDGETTTLGRGGSDLSASLIGACLGAREIHIWTDTDGVLSADPRVLPAARTVRRLSCREASALAHFGAKVLHPATVAPAAARGIAVRVLNARRPSARGTVIAPGRAARRTPVAGLASVADAFAIEVALPRDATRERVLADAFRRCADRRARVFVSNVSDDRVWIVAGEAGSVGARGGADRLVDDHHAVAAVALLAVVGDGLADGRVLARDVLDALDGVPVLAVSTVADAGYVAAVVERPQLARATRQLHARFFGAQRRARTPHWRAAARLAGVPGAPATHQSPPVGAAS